MKKQIWAFNRIAGRTLQVICKEDYDEEKGNDRKNAIQFVEGTLEGYDFDDVIVIDGVLLPVEKRSSIQIKGGSI